MTDTTKIPDYPFGGRAFVWARPKNGKWSDFDGTNGLGDDPHDFRPCKVSGHDTGQRISVAGSAYGYYVDEFEIVGPCVLPEDMVPAPADGPGR